MSPREFRAPHACLSTTLREMLDQAVGLNVSVCQRGGRKYDQQIYVIKSDMNFGIAVAVTAGEVRTIHLHHAVTRIMTQ